KEQINKIEESENELLEQISVHMQNIKDFVRNKDAFDKPTKQDLIGKEIRNASLNPDDFIPEDETSIRGKVRKYHYKLFGEEVALKKLEIGSGAKQKVPNTLELQIGILKTINESRDIIKYIGLVTINSQKFLVTEWAEYGTLREYYEMKNPDISIRARLALEIA
ncbi:13787_t:CDS:1, partial [Racocetra fulgida]